MEELKEILGKAEKLLTEKVLDKNALKEVENFILKNENKLGKEKLFVNLKKLVEEVASRHGLPTLKSQQENFGSNSCSN